MTNSHFETQLLVLGAGPGGYTAAFRAADLGMQVTLVDSYPNLGGVCLNAGCIPSKSLLHIAKVIDDAQHLARHGVKFSEPTLDLNQLRSWKESVVNKLTKGLITLAKQRKVQIIQGLGQFIDAHHLAIDTNTGKLTVSFQQAIIAVGSSPATITELPTDSRIIDSTGALALTDIPAKLLIIGGGVIGLEMATIYAALGSQVTIVELADRLIPECDHDLIRPLQRRLTTKGVTINLTTKLVGVETAANALNVSLSNAQGTINARFDRILVAIGRRPNGKNINCAAAGVIVNEQGFILVDRQQRTNIQHIYALGDVVGNPMLAHKAMRQAKIAAEVSAGHNSVLATSIIPSVAYTDPEIAWVGLTENTARHTGIVYEKAVFPWAASGRALSSARDEGLTKLLFDPNTQRLLGAGIVGVNAGELIGEMALAIEMGAKAHDLSCAIHPHPSLSETLAAAAEVFTGTVTDLYLKKTLPKT